MIATKESPSTAVFSAIAEQEDRSPVELTPLATVIDPDALDNLLATDTETPQVSFEYCGYTVTVTSETVQLQKLDKQS